MSGKSLTVPFLINLPHISLNVEFQSADLCICVCCFTMMNFSLHLLLLTWIIHNADWHPFVVFFLFFSFFVIIRQKQSLKKCALV